MLQGEVELPDYKEIGKRIRMARNEEGITQEALGVKLGISQEHMNRIEKGRNRPSVKLLFAMCQVLEKDMNYFFMDDPNISTDVYIKGELAERVSRCDVDMLKLICTYIDNLFEVREKTVRKLTQNRI